MNVTFIVMKKCSLCLLVASYDLGVENAVLNYSRCINQSSFTVAYSSDVSGTWRGRHMGTPQLYWGTFCAHMANEGETWRV